MNISRTMDCLSAREALSARLDAELADERPLRDHLRACEPCRRHEQGLGELARGWQALRAATPPAELWERIERRARARPVRPTSGLRRVVLANAAAGLVGFLALTATVRWLAGAPSDGTGEHHWLAPLLPRPLENGAAAQVAARPELRLLRAFPPNDASTEERR